MKRLGLTPLFAAATLFLGGNAGAEEARPAAATPSPKPEASSPAMKPVRGEDLLKRFDKNGDGKLDEHERAEARKYAADHGPRLNPAELVKRFDRDGDGKLNVEEVAGLVAFLREMRTANAPSVSPATKAEAERLDRVSSEVARRRELREQAVKTGGPKPEPKP